MDSFPETYSDPLIFISESCLLRFIPFDLLGKSKGQGEMVTQW